VHRYADAACSQDLLGPSATGRHGVLNPHKPYLLQARIDEGVTATSPLLQGITACGCRGGERALRRWLIDARRAPAETARAPTAAHLPHHHRPDHAPAARARSSWLGVIDRRWSIPLAFNGVSTAG
jgi:hypothetical protein